MKINDNTPPNELLVLRSKAFHSFVYELGVTPDTLLIPLGFQAFHDVQEASAHVTGTKSYGH
jgi:hypothetical protein